MIQAAKIIGTGLATTKLIGAAVGIGVVFGALILGVASVIYLIQFSLFNKLTIACDAARPWGVYFQDSASPQMEALVELHDNIMFYLVIILFGVAWILLSIIRNYAYGKSPISNKYVNHGTLIELIWTISPALILILIAFPSFKLLYLMDEITDPSLTVFVEGHQWHWSYQYPDFLNDDNEELEFDLKMEEAASSLDVNSAESIKASEDRTANCTHDSCSGFESTSQQDIDENFCDFASTRGDPLEKHLAFRYIGETIRHCNECHANFCQTCDLSDSITPVNGDNS